MDHPSSNPPCGPTLQELFPAEGSGRAVECIMVEQINSRAWRVRSRWMDQGVPQSTFALTTATIENMKAQAQVVADRSGLVIHYLPRQPHPVHAPAVLLLIRR